MNVLQNEAPALETEALAALAERHFGLRGSLRPLPSERDQNARLTTESGSFVLKLSNPAEDPGQIALQSAVLAHLETVGMAGIPRLVRTRDGAAAAQVALDRGPAALRLVTWIDGVPMAEAARSPAQLSALGRYMGTLKPTGLRPKFLDKMAHANVHVDPMLFAMGRA